MKETRKTTVTTIIIFGASGDLTHRKLIPALFSLYRKGRLPDDTHVLGFARRPWSTAEFRKRLKSWVEKHARQSFRVSIFNDFASRISYLQGNLRTLEDYGRLNSYLTEQEGRRANRLYYMATAPEYYGTIAENLGNLGMTGEKTGFRRTVVEKPFGRDLSSARELNQALYNVFREKQIYRIDHYLGKETSQNILFFRFANTIFEPVWNRNYVDNIQISVAEDLRIERRGGYYDTAGVLRDMFQNHLLQLLSLVAMEPPASFDADVVRNEKIKVFSAVRPVSLKNTVRGQYRGYSEEENVAPGSETPTYAAIKLYVDNWRWQNVPFYLRSGKAMARKTSEIVIQFKCPPHVMFDLPPGYQLSPNLLTLYIQPDEGIHLKFETKVPDSAQETRSVNMEFHYDTSFGGIELPDAYERLLLDSLQGDASLFTRGDGIELSWMIIDPIVKGFETPKAPPLVTYEPGGWGPVEADEFMSRDRRVWWSGSDRFKTSDGKDQHILKYR